MATTDLKTKYQNKVLPRYSQILQILVLALLGMAGFSIFTMVAVTCADVILRSFGVPVVGAYDIVKMAGATALACSLPYTTALRGHVAIEYFFHKLGRKSRLIVDGITRLFTSLLFVFLGYRSFVYGNKLNQNNQVTQTLQLPVFWVAYVIGFCCFVVALVIIYNLIHPDKELVKA